MNRLFGAKQTGPKPTLSSAISNVRPRLLSTSSKLIPHPDRHPRRRHRRQTRQTKRRTNNLPTTHVQNARRPRQNRSKTKSAQDLTTAKNVRRAARPTPTTELEYGASNHDDRKSKECHDDRRRDERYE